MQVTLELQLPATRDRTALASLKSMGNPVATGLAVASACPDRAAAHGNPDRNPLRPWGHPPAGRYRLITRERLAYGHSPEYGWHALLFEAEEGEALAAQAAGRVGLLLYGGPAGADGLLRRTQGGVRLDKPLMDLLDTRFLHARSCELTITLVPTSARWQVWKPRLPPTPALSTSPVAVIETPMDEASLIARLLADIQRRRSGTGTALSGSSDPLTPSADGTPSRESPATSNLGVDHSQDYTSTSSGSTIDDTPSGHSGGGASGDWDR